jgi:hypothetical protein
LPLTGPGRYRRCLPHDHAHHGSDDAGARGPKEVSAVNNTIATDLHADFAMPTWRDRVAVLRGLPMITGVDLMVARHTCAPSIDAAGIAGEQSATTVVSTTGAFPGTPAWSPPI